MWVETKQQIIAILKTLTAPTSTYYTVAESIPPDRSDHHGYLILVRPQRDTVQTPVSADQRTHVLNFAIDVFSPQVLTGITIVNEYRIEAYADAITVLLERYPTLGDVATKRGLTGVRNTFVAGTQFQTPRPYPDGQQAQQYYSCTVNLQVTFHRATGC